eukprot:gene4460-6709_t
MPKKKPSKKAKSAKSRKSAKSKKPANPVRFQEAVPLQWPWASLVNNWLPNRPFAFTQLKAQLRNHYIAGDGIVCTQDEWKKSLYLYKRQYEVPELESLVQMLTCFLAEEGTRKLAADNFILFAAALRFRHGESHFERMYKELKRWFQKLDEPNLMQQILAFFDPERLGEYRDHFSVTEARQLLESDMVITFGLNDILRSSGEPMEGDELLEPFTSHLLSNKLDLQTFFVQLDTKNEGFVTNSVFLSTLQKLELDTNKDAVDLLLTEFDPEKTGFIYYPQLGQTRIHNILARQNTTKAVLTRAGSREKAMEVIGKVLRLTYDEFVLFILFIHYHVRP